MATKKEVKQYLAYWFQLVDTPRDKSTGILGSTKPLNLESLRHLDQRWDSPQALIRVCPTLFALVQVLFCLKQFVSKC